MKNNRPTVWLALAIILLVLLGVFGPWSSDSNPTPDPPEQNSAQESEAPPLLDEGGELAQLEGTAIDRTTIDAVPAGLTVFEIREPDGELVIDALVILCRGDSLLHSALSDSDGTIEYQSDGNPITLVIAARGRPVAMFSVDLVPGRQEIQLPQGAKISGKLIQHDGTAPGQMPLSLRSDHPLFDYSTLPAVALEELGVRARYNSISTLIQPGGLFRFDGLAESWSGLLRLTSGSRIQQSNAGMIDPPGFALRLEAPQVGLLIELAKPHVITGRLIERQSNTPLGNVQICAKHTQSHSPEAQLITVTTDRHGYFRLTLDPVHVARLELFFGSRPLASHAFLSLDATEIPPHGDLGDLEVESGRQIQFQLNDRNGQAIAGGFALAGGLKSQVTNPDGESNIPWLPPDVARLRFIADGYIPVDYELQEVIPDPLVVTLDAGNRLELEFMIPPGVEVDQFRAELQSDSLIINGPARDLKEVRDYVGEDSHPSYQGPGPMVGSHLIAKPNFDGLVVFQHLRSDIELSLKIFGMTGDSVFYSETLKPLGEAEIRRHVIDLRQVGAVFHGRVTDLDGNPLVRATVQHANQILDWTDNLGEFSCLVNVPEPKTLVISHNASATLFMHDYLLPTDGAPVEFRLEPARRVTIEVVDEAGTPISNAQVFVLRSGFTSNTINLGGGRYERGGLSSSESLSVQVTVAGKVYVRDLDLSKPTTQVVLPIHGSLTVDFTPPNPPLAGSYAVVLRATIGEQFIVLSQAVDAASGWGCDFPLVIPGQYEALISYEASPAEQAAGVPSRVLGAPTALRIEVAKHSQLRLQ